MTLPRISIVTPSFNQGVFIEETIRSVIEQDYPNLEYVVIDGGSSDDSVEIIKKYESHISHWESVPDEGHGHAINKGFAHTSGEIMAWINSDDKYTPWAFRTVGEIFKNFSHVNWIVGMNGHWNSEGAMIDAFRNPKNIYDFLSGKHRWIQQESVFWRRSLWDRAGGHINQEYKFMIDGELWSRFFLHDELFSLDCILGGYRIHATNRAKENLETCEREMEKAISVMRQNCPEQCERVAKWLNRLGVVQRWPLIRRLPLENWIRHQVMASELPIVDYRNLKFEDDHWEERILTRSAY